MKQHGLLLLLLLSVIVLGQTEEITFTKDISSIIYNKCTSCHRSGESGPMSFTSYEEVASLGGMIEYVTQNNYMPPWPPDPDYTSHSMLGERFLTPSEKNLISQWVKQGLPEGDPVLEADMPIFTEGSSIGVPDYVFQLEEEYFIEGTANQYTNPTLETGAIVDSNHRYLTRLIVRRPQAENYNGTVIVEWINVTGGPDKDIDWWYSGSHFMRNGYAYVAVSAQQMGIDTMKEWSPERYGHLDVTHDGMVDRDALSYDIFSAVDEKIKTIGCEKHSKQGCNGRSSKCITHDLWDELEDYLKIFFKKKNLGDLVNQTRFN